MPFERSVAGAAFSNGTLKYQFLFLAINALYSLVFI
jgi:hypothetical protein